MMGAVIYIDPRCCLECGHIYCGLIECPIEGCDGLGEPFVWDEWEHL